MNFRTPLFALAALGISSAVASAASLNLGSLGQTFPTYTDSAGIKLSYVRGDRNAGGTDFNGLGPNPSPFTRGMRALTVNPHLAMIRNDEVVIDFSGTAQGVNSVTFTFWDLDTVLGEQEGVVVHHAGGATTIFGAGVSIPDASAAGAPTNTGAFDPSGGAKGIIRLVGLDAGQAYAFTFNYNVGGPIPEPTAGLLGLLGAGIFFRRRR